MEKAKIKAVFSTDDKVHVNAEFVKAKHLMIFEVTPDSFSLVSTLDFAGGEGGGMENPRVTGLKGCAVVFVPKAISGEVALGLIRSKVFVTKLDQVEEITSLLPRLQAMLRGTPPLWLRKAMHGEAAQPAELQ